MTTQTDNGKKQVPSVILTPVAVTTDKINDTVIKEDRPEIRGMIAAVRHLVDVEEVNE